MVEYKFFTLNASGVIDTADRARFADDALALAHARQLAPAGRIEIWTGGHRLGVVPAARGRPGVAAPWIERRAG